MKAASSVAAAELHSMFVLKPEQQVAAMLFTPL